MFELAGLGGLVVIGLSIWSLIMVWSSGAPTRDKLTWSLVVAMPLLGPLVWITSGPGPATHRPQQQRHRHQHG